MTQAAVQQTNLSPVQAQVAGILAQGHSMTAAARQAGVHRSTIYHWLQHSLDFKTAAEEAQEEYLATLTDEMHDLSASTHGTLRSVLENPETHDTIRLKAALAVLQHPQYPNQGWHLPERIESPRQQQVIDTLAEIKAEFEVMRMQNALAKGTDAS